MAIVDGVYEEKISTTYKTVEMGVDEIKKRLANARKMRISNLPIGLLTELLPLLAGKDVMVVLPRGAEPSADLKAVGPVAIQKARIYKDHKGIEAEVGSIYLSDTLFSIVWADGKTLEVQSMGYAKCVKCMRKFFDTAWRYAAKAK